MKIKSTIFVLTLLVLFNIDSFAQDNQQKRNETPFNANIKFSGFVKYDAFYDTRINEEALEGLVSLYPKAKLADSEGNDLNTKGTFNMLAIATRLKTEISGPDAFGAKTTGYFEFDFTGRSNTAALRFREGWIKMKWENTILLVGRHWHPLFVDDVFPSALSMNTGAPFQVFNRSAQISLKQKMGNFIVHAALISQSDYTSSGPDGKSANYIKWAQIPNLHLQLQYKSENMVAGVAGDYKMIQPRLYTTSLIAGNKNTFQTSDKIGSYCFMAYAKFESGKISMKCKSMYGQNLSEHLMLGGYAVSAIDDATGKETYTPSNNIFAWVNVMYGNKFKVGIFGGYSKNLGFSDNVIAKKIDGNGRTVENIYGMGNNLAYAYRVSPALIYKTGSLQFSLEMEYTVATYGTNDLLDKGKVKDSQEYSNSRLIYTMYFFF